MSASLYCAQCGALNQPQAATCFACGRSLTEPASPAADARRLIHGRYRLVRQLGVGGFGAVYQAEDTTLGNRLVAVKEMSPRGLTTEEAREATQAFQREALLLAGLAHPSLPRIYERFEEDGRWYLVMDFIAGETLEVYLDKRGGNLPVKEALQMALQLSEVLDYLHSRQPSIIFRDLKPSNVIRTPDGQLALVDFGIARLFKPGQSKDTMAFGSPGYAAPEQYGKAQTTTRSDVFSLGALLHQMLTGIDPSEKPFRFAPLTMPRPAGLSGLIGLMVKMDEDKRPRSMEVIKRELTALLDVPPTSWLADDLALTGASSSPSGTAVSPVLMKQIAQLVPVPGGAQMVSYNAPPAQPLQGNAAPQKPKSSGWVAVLVGMLLCVGIPVIAGLVAFQHSSQSTITDTYPNTNGGYSYTPIDQSTATSIPAGSVTATAMPGASVPAAFALAWSPDGTQIASGGSDGKVALWNATTGALRLNLKTGFTQVYTLAWSPNGRYLAVAGYESELQIWNADGSIYRTYQIAAFNNESLSWSPDNEHLVLASANGPVQVIDMLSASITLLVSNSGNGFYTVAWSPDGKYIAAGSDAQTVKVWQSTTNQIVYTYRGDQSTGIQGSVTAIAWSPDSKRIASADYDDVRDLGYAVQVWDALTGKNLLFYRGEHYSVNALAWSPNGSYIASGDDGNMIQVWSPNNATPLFTFSKQTKSIQALVWSPDSTRIASSSMDGTVQIWDALSGANIVTFQQP